MEIYLLKYNQIVRYIWLFYLPPVIRNFENFTYFGNPDQLIIKVKYIFTQKKKVKYIKGY